MIIKIFSKTKALKGKFEIETLHVPRVGEMIYPDKTAIDPQISAPEISHIVYDVFYEMSNQNLTPVVLCMEAPPEDRNLRLQEHGWL